MGKKKKPGLEGIADILAGLKESTALGRNLEEAQIWQRWPELAGMDFMPHGRPLGVREGTLIIEVDSAVWMHKFAYTKRDLVRRINRMIGRNLVTDIYLTLTEEEKLSDPQDRA
jgi:predicted nucleic acid-binding Zn ribbon protein